MQDDSELEQGTDSIELAYKWATRDGATDYDIQLYNEFSALKMRLILEREIARLSDIVDKYKEAREPSTNVLKSSVSAARIREMHANRTAKLRETRLKR